MDNEFLKDLVEEYQVVILTTWPREKVWKWLRGKTTIAGVEPVIVWTCRTNIKGEE